MSRIALVVSGIVLQVPVPVVEGFALADCYHPDVLGNCVPVADGVEVGWTRAADGSFVAPIPGAVADTVAPAVTTKYDLYLRCSEAEDAALADAIAAAPARYRRLFDAATRFDHGSDVFATLRATLVRLFGEARADALLLPS